ncbi:protoporphyrinogen/coproporphyrinogen III oxidase [Alternaria panax]|uniref:Protoporphyrinogen oxidase n=1 Tax=Alternaria panax TaxID=48097 RepID=A0AAD4IFF5_9PLEO|nr:protoporphyrinogen/coproporphyrinogen III oxidase [Alternaria panax]
MRLQNVSHQTLKTVAVRPALASHAPSPLHPHRPHVASSQRLLLRSTAPHAVRYQSSYPERIAILGGGIAGLSSAYFIAREFPNSKVVVFEAGKDKGGWIKSRRVEVVDSEGKKGNVLFELGPRTLRNATVTAGLIQDLGLVDDVTFTRRTEPGAKNRFIYYPDQLNRLPSQRPSLADFVSLWRTGILSGAFGIVTEPMKPKRPDSLSDETVGSFLARRVDKRLAENIVSAVFHGIYAGDINQLSAKTLLSLAWQLEGKYGNALGGFFRMQNEDPRPEQVILVHPYDREVAKAMNEEIDLELGFARNLKDSAMFSFRNGLQQMVKALVDTVENKGNVEIRTEAPIQSFKPLNENGKLGVEVVSGNEGSTSTESFDLAISTLKNDEITPYVTVMTVNLYYPNANLLPVEGFGYLIPQSIPFEQNPERALGVIFDSSAVKGQDTANGTKLTVMMGGHWWDGWTEYPSEEEGLEMAKSVLKRHIGITEEPTAHIANLSRDCIPQYTLGYADRIKEFAESVSSEFKGRLRVVGAQFNGVGVNDIITAAWQVSRGLRGEGWKGRSCGLDRVMDEREWTVVPASEMAYIRKEVGHVGSQGMDRRGDGGV